VFNRGVIHEISGTRANRKRYGITKQRYPITLTEIRDPAPGTKDTHATLIL
jgi:hypothetical protein